MATKHAEVAGAGLAGLMAATRLAQLGWSVRLHERNSELRMFGLASGCGRTACARCRQRGHSMRPSPALR